MLVSCIAPTVMLRNVHQKPASGVHVRLAAAYMVVSRFNCHRHSGPQGQVEPLTIIDDPAAWTARDYPNLEQACDRTILISLLADLLPSGCSVASAVRLVVCAFPRCACMVVLWHCALADEGQPHRSAYCLCSTSSGCHTMTLLSWTPPCTRPQPLARTLRYVCSISSCCEYAASLRPQSANIIAPTCLLQTTNSLAGQQMLRVANVSCCAHRM